MLIPCPVATVTVTLTRIGTTTGVCCNTGFQCFEQNEWYSQCRESCDKEGWACFTAAPTNSPTTKQPSPTVGCFGDSITRGDASHEGDGVINPGRGNYPLALADALGAAVGNYGVSGATTESYAAKEEYAAGIASEPDYAVVMLGHNDAKQVPFDEAAFRESYSRVLASIGDAAGVVFALTPVPAIDTCCGIDIDIVNDELPGAVAGAVGDLGGGFVLVDAARGWTDATACFPEASRPATCADYYVDDGLHLSAQGSDLLAALVLEAIVAYEGRDDGARYEASDDDDRPVVRRANAFLRRHFPYVALLLFCMVVLLLYLVLRVKMLSYLRSRRELFKPVESPPPEKV